MERKLMRLVALAWVFACGAAAAQERYEIDGTHTTPMYEVTHAGMSLQRGFFTSVQGRVVLDREAKKGSIDVVISTGSVTTSSRILNDVLKRGDYFNSEKYPAMHYVSSDLVFEGDVPVAANGELTLLAVTKPVPIKIADFHCGTHPLFRRAACSAEVTATLRRSDFGMTGGLPSDVGDDVRIVIPVEAIAE